MISESQIKKIRRDRRIYKKALSGILEIRENDNQSRCSLGRGRTSGIEDCAYIAEMAFVEAKT